ncbi:MAG: HEPN domain-containing protein [Chloroflexi bacterium]|nr:HEPN domain-containing protein [Chloroflexota bacterium]
MDAEYLAYLDKAIESLAGAESEFANRRYNNCANRCYYAMFQAAIAALMAAGIRPVNVRGQWNHDFVQAQFSGVLITRRKLYPSDLAAHFSEVGGRRLTADYGAVSVSRTVAERVVQKTRLFVFAVQRRIA